jgi:hypothetical protein
MVLAKARIVSSFASGDSVFGRRHAFGVEIRETTECSGIDCVLGSIRHQIKGTRLELNLYYDSEVWGDRLNQDSPAVKLQDEAGGANYEIPWRRIAPGQFSLSRDLNEGSLVKGAIRVGDHALAFGPVSVGSSVEWAFESERLEKLRQVSHQTNGRKLLNLEDA